MISHGLGSGGASRYRFRLLIIGNDLVADVDALIADVNGGTRNHFFIHLRFPQKEQVACRRFVLTIVVGILLRFDRTRITWEWPQRYRGVQDCNHLTVALDAFVTNNALLPIICWGTPGRAEASEMCSTSPLDVRKMTQLNLRAFIFAIIHFSLPNYSRDGRSFIY